jgi:hypothetical protein
VIRAIESFDRLARSTYSDVRSRTVFPDRVRVRQTEWHGVVERLLLDVLGDSKVEPSARRASQPVNR